MEQKIFSILIFLFLVSFAFACKEKPKIEKTGLKTNYEQGKPNPYLSAPVYGITHFNPGQTDAIPYEVKKGTYNIDLTKCPHVPGGPVNIQNIASTEKGFMWTVSTDRVSYVNCNEGNWNAVAYINFPGVNRGDLNKLYDTKYESMQQVEALAKDLLGPDPQSITSNGLYTLADKDNIIYANSGTVINAIGLKDKNNPKSGLEIKRSLDFAKVMPPMDFPGLGKVVKLIGMNMTYDGNLIIGAFNGIAIIDREFKNPAVIYTIEEGQLISNSLSVDEKNGIYIASGSMKNREDGILRKVVWSGAKISTDEKDGAWSSHYDGGDWPPAIKAGTGTGSTPSLMGFGPNEDKLVVITDGVNRMKIVAFWRDEIPKDFKQKPGTKSIRIADQFEITAGLPKNTEWVQSEQSCVVGNNGAFVVNNVILDGHKDKLVDVLTIGPIVNPPQGMERVEWSNTTHSWKSVWTKTDVNSTSMVPALSLASNIVFVNGYTKERGWEVTGMDWNTGEVVNRTIFGFSNYGNGAYAILQFMENGDLLFNSVAGPFRVSYK